MNYKVRMLDELSMTEEEHRLLSDQVVAMKRYYEILYKRLTDFITQ